MAKIKKEKKSMENLSGDMKIANHYPGMPCVKRATDPWTGSLLQQTAQNEAVFGDYVDNPDEYAYAFDGFKPIEITIQLPSKKISKNKGDKVCDVSPRIYRFEIDEYCIAIKYLCDNCGQRKLVIRIERKDGMESNDGEGLNCEYYRG